VLTHFHADHVDGLPGILTGRQVAELHVTALREPEQGARRVEEWAAAAGVPVRVPAHGEVARAGPLSWQVVGPAPGAVDSPNDASVVVLAEVGGIRVLLTGDVEPLSQSRLLRQAVAPVDVLKVPHHGSSYQDPRLLTDLGARVALVSVGADNDYGHPDEGVLDTLTDAGALVRRTDRDGDVAVVVRDGHLRVVARS
jgi:competence protein ComEC